MSRYSQYRPGFVRSANAAHQKEEKRRLRERLNALQAKKWTLINNGSHDTYPFSSEKKLRDFARTNGMIIKKSQTAEFTFYTEAYTFVPGQIL